MRELKLVNLGLRDAVDPAFCPDGSLTKAKNARYRPGSLTLWQAEGREQAGTAAGLESIGGIVWDPPYGPELVYWDGGTFRLWPAGTSPDDPRFSISLDFAHTGYGVTRGPLPMEVVSVPGGFLLLDGGKPKFVYRVKIDGPSPLLTDGERSIAIAGLRTIKGYKTKRDPAHSISQGKVITLSRVSGTSGLTPNLVYSYWAVFMGIPNADNDVFVNTPSITYGTPGISGCESGAVVSRILANPSGTSADADVKLLINISDEEYADTNWEYLAIYRNNDGMPSVNGVLPSAFPNGIMVGVVRRSSSKWSRKTDAGPTTYWQCEIKQSQLGGEDSHENYLPFEYVVASAAGKTVGVSRDDAPPTRCSTGDVFQDCVLLNDLDNPRKLVYSFPGLYQQFPSALYFLTMNSSENDRVSAIKSLGQVCIVLTTTGCWRVASLPTAADFDFSHGEVQTMLAESVGCPRPQAATKAHLPQPFGTVCCWVSARGIFATNGFEVVELTGHIDWKKINVKLDSCNLVDDPTEHRLVFHDGNSNLYYLHYHPAHIIDSTIAITGPITRPGGVKHLFRFYTEAGKPQVASLDAAGKLFYEGRGNTDESTGDQVVFEAWSKEYYPAGLGGSGSSQKIFSHISAAPNLSGTYGIVIYPGPDQAGQVIPLESVTRQLLVSAQSIYTESLIFVMTGTGAQDFGINAIGWDWDDDGTT